MPSSAVTRKANKATAGDLAVSIPLTLVVRDKNFSFSIKAASDIGDEERNQMWRIFEENMYELYCSSSFGWNPEQKRKEMFDPLSRFVIAREIPDPTSSLDVVAYAIFRFEREDRQNVIYCYELQVSKNSRRFGLGRILTQMLSDIGAKWNMGKIMLTVFRANHTAMLFYTSTGFNMDETSPDFLKDQEEYECDYSILSRCISQT